MFSELQNNSDSSTAAGNLTAIGIALSIVFGGHKDPYKTI
jgi:hypothetical protein